MARKKCAYVTLTYRVVAGRTKDTEHTHEYTYTQIRIDNRYSKLVAREGALQ